MRIAQWLRTRAVGGKTNVPRRRIDLGDSLPAYPLYAIGDVHGCINELRDAEERVARDIRLAGRQGLVILLGDYVDRGLRSRDVLEHLIQPSALGLKRLPLCGNHDDLFGRFINRPDLNAEWLKLGGNETLISYGIDLQHLSSRHNERLHGLRDILQEAIPPSHHRFLENLPIYIKVGNFLFVHAGIRPGLPLEEQTDQDMMWIRDPFLSKGPKISLIVIHGHTPNKDPEIGPGRVGIDTGAYYSGKLAVLKIDGGRATLL